MDSIYINEVIDRLIGHVDAAGETNYDDDSLANLTVLADVLYHVANLCLENIKHVDRTEYSMRNIGNKSIMIISELIKYCNQYLK